MDIEQAVVKALGTAAPGKVYAAAAIKGAAAPFVFYILHRDEAVEELDGDTALRAAPLRWMPWARVPRIWRRWARR